MSVATWVIEPDAYLEPKLSATGFGADPARTIIEVFKEASTKHRDRPALLLKRKDSAVSIFIYELSFLTLGFCFVILLY